MDGIKNINAPFPIAEHAEIESIKPDNMSYPTFILMVARFWHERNTESSI